MILKNIACVLIDCAVFLPWETKQIYKYYITRTTKYALNRYGVPHGFEGKEKQLAKAMKKALFDYGLFYEEFMLYGLCEKSPETYGNYVSEVGRYAYCKKYNSKKEAPLFRSKCAQAKRFGEYYKRKVLCIQSKKQVEEFTEFFKTHGRIIVKPDSSSCGDGVQVVEYTDDSNAKYMLEQLLKKGHFVCEELLQNSDSLKKYNPTSLNTVRYVKSPDGHPAFTPFIRFGRYGKCVDNAGAGGIFASIDPKSGIVTSVARDENGGYYPNHPDSGVKVKGFALPKWNDALTLISELESTVDSSLISWDIAHTTRGWVLIEGNFAGQLVCQQGSKPHDPICPIV